MVWLNEIFSEAWRDENPFEAVERLEGEVFRSVKSRKTLRFELAGKSWFAKIHRGVGWHEILKNLLQLKTPVLGAENEWRALRLLEERGVETMKPAAFGSEGRNPARRRSFLVTEELVGTESLEDFCRDWPERPPPVALKRALIERVATMLRTMHAAGMNHRDCYVCHFLLNVSGGRERVDPKNLSLSVIDLHRAQLRRRTPERWKIKDLAGLWFSAMEIGLTSRDRLRFVRVYSGRSLRGELAERRSVWRRVDATAERLRAKEARNPKG